MSHNGSSYHKAVTQRDEADYSYQWHLSDISELCFSPRIFEYSELPNFKKIVQLRAETFPADGRTDRRAWRCW